MGASPAGLTMDAIEDFLVENDVDEEGIGRVRSVLAFCDSVQYSGGTADDPAQVRDLIEGASQIVRDLEEKKLS